MVKIHKPARKQKKKVRKLYRLLEIFHNVLVKTTSISSWFCKTLTHSVYSFLPLALIKCLLSCPWLKYSYLIPLFVEAFFPYIFYIFNWIWFFFILKLRQYLWPYVVDALVCIDMEINQLKWPQLSYMYNKILLTAQRTLCILFNKTYIIMHKLNLKSPINTQTLRKWIE